MFEPLSRTKGRRIIEMIWRFVQRLKKCRVHQQFASRFQNSKNLICYQLGRMIVFKRIHAYTPIKYGILKREVVSVSYDISVTKNCDVNLDNIRKPFCGTASAKVYDEAICTGHNRVRLWRQAIAQMVNRNAEGVMPRNHLRDVVDTRPFPS